MWPILEIAGMRFPTYNLALVAGVIAGLAVLFLAARRKRVALQFLADNLVTLVAVTVLSARLVEVWINKYPLASIPFFWQENGGFSFYGGLVGFLIALYLFCRKYGENFFVWLDLISLAGVVTLVFHHIGTFLSGEAYGIPTVLFWGVTFTNPDSAVLTTLPIHPVQIYTALLALIFFIAAVIISKHTRTAGKAGIFILLTLSVSYFLLDFLRGDSAPMFGFLRASQYFALAFATIAAALIFKMKHEKISASGSELHIQ
jgi:phosphatidylglycerol:prolipoprotein diacylglycerol transferase